MLKSLKELSGYTISAVDGVIGRVDDFSFDDQAWTVRYLIARTDSWLTVQHLLLSPEALGEADRAAQALPVALTKEQVQNSPTLDVDKPVSRQMEAELYAYYDRSPYWRASAPAFGLGAAAVGELIAATQEAQAQQEGDSHLHSAREVIGYSVQAADGEIGHLEDFLCDDKSWRIRHLVVNAHSWQPGRMVLLSRGWVESVRWAEKCINVSALRETLRAAPEFETSSLANGEAKTRILEFFGQSKRWILI